MDDVANQYCVIAKHGGLLALFLFIRVIALGFREVGTGIKEAERDWPTRIMIWAIGVMLFAHATAFFGISYFDQMKLAWYVSLAMVCSVGVLTEKRAEAEVRNEEVLQGEIPDGIPTPAR
jgi:hypothetical protein